MKEVVRWMGGGILGLLVAFSFVLLYQNWGNYWGSLAVGLGMPQRGDAFMNKAYEEDRRQQNVDVMFAPNESLRTNHTYDLNAYLKIKNGNDEMVGGEIKKVVNKQTGEEVKAVDGEWIFKESGVYEIILHCKYITFSLHVPVNEGGTEE